jgi:hypothetical protein
LQKLNRNFMTAKNSNVSNRLNRIKKLETEIDTEYKSNRNNDIFYEKLFNRPLLEPQYLTANQNK